LGNSTDKCIIALDAMGGDNAPLVTVRGASQALKESQNRFDVLLVGKNLKLNE